MRHGHAANVMVAEERFERDRRRQFARADQRACDLEDAAMDLLDEMLAPQEIGNAVERIIVDKDRAEQRLLGLEVVRRRAIGAVLRLGLALCELFNRRHGDRRFPGQVLEIEANANVRESGVSCDARSQRGKADATPAPLCPAPSIL